MRQRDRAAERVVGEESRRRAQSARRAADSSRAAAKRAAAIERTAQQAQTVRRACENRLIVLGGWEDNPFVILEDPFVILEGEGGFPCNPTGQTSVSKHHGPSQSHAQSQCSNARRTTEYG